MGVNAGRKFAPIENCQCNLCEELRAKQTTDKLEGTVPEHYWKLDPYWHARHKQYPIPEREGVKKL